MRVISDDRMAIANEHTPRGRGKKTLVKVELLDGSLLDVDIERKSRAEDLLDKICDHLELMEKDYFGLLHEKNGDPRVWVDLDKPLQNIFKGEPWEVRLAVKFYPRDPHALGDDTTRYQLELAVRAELREGRLSCSHVTYALLASYALQSQLGDYEDNVGVKFNEFNLVPLDVLTPEMEEKIMELYKNHRGQTPSEADLHYLENAVKLNLYGVDLHHAKDSDDVDIALGVCANGVSVFKESLPLNQFPWTKIVKIAYNKRSFSLKLRPSEFDEFQTTVCFKLPTTYAAKKLWKSCVEHHIFFRRTSAVTVARVASLPRLGSKLRYSRRTLHQIRQSLYDDCGKGHSDTNSTLLAI